MINQRLFQSANLATFCFRFFMSPT